MAVLLLLFGVMIHKIWRFRWEQLILWWNPTLSSKGLASEIALILITVVPMRPLSTVVYIVIGICSGIVLGNSGAEWQSSCCSTSMIESNKWVNYELFWKLFWFADNNIESKKLRTNFII